MKRIGTFVALVLLGALGCKGDAREASQPPVASAGSGGSRDVPSNPAPDAALGDECPPPRRDPRVSCSTQELWARNPSSGACCSYASPCELPEGWGRFPSESECQSSCRCADITPTDFSGAESGNLIVGTERISLECGCGVYACPSTLAAALDDACAGPSDGIRPTLVRGCGRVALRSFGGFTGSELVFAQDTGRLIGMLWFSDVPLEPCNTYDTTAGQAFLCESATECDPCASDAGASTSVVPPCE